MTEGILALWSTWSRVHDYRVLGRILRGVMSLALEGLEHAYVANYFFPGVLSWLRVDTTRGYSIIYLNTFFLFLIMERRGYDFLMLFGVSSIVVFMLLKSSLWLRKGTGMTMLCYCEAAFNGVVVPLKSLPQLWSLHLDVFEDMYMSA